MGRQDRVPEVRGVLKEEDQGLDDIQNMAEPRRFKTLAAVFGDRHELIEVVCRKTLAKLRNALSRQVHEFQKLFLLLRVALQQFIPGTNASRPRWYVGWRWDF